MQKTARIFTIAVALVGFVSSSFAQESATATASATIVTPISITRNVDLKFGNVAVQSATGGTVVLDTAGVRTPTDGVTLPAITGIVSAASFTIGGTANYAYGVTLPSSVTLNSGGNTMTADVFTSNPSGLGGVLSAGGSQTLKVGATLNVAAAQAAGSYLSTTPFTVTVVYN